MGSTDDSYETIDSDSATLISDSEEAHENSNSIYLDAVLNQLNIKLEDCYEEFITEKALPYSPENTVMVIPRVTQKEEDFLVMDAYIVVIDNNTKNIINKYYEKDAWTSDAIMLNTISIDTAPYKLNETTRAFGVKLSYANSSRPNPYSESSISLFVPQDNTLVKVLDGYPIYTHHGEWDTMCSGQFESTQTVLIMSGQQTNGYNNITAKSTITTEITKPKGDDCDSEESTENSSETLRFEDGKYQYKKRSY